MSAPKRNPPPYRNAGMYSQLVYLHAETVAKARWDRDPHPCVDAAGDALSDARKALKGLEQYQAHPFRRFAPEPPTLWRSGAVRVLDFGGSGPSVLAIPSMINRATIMDLSPRLSPLRWLASRGFRVFLLDWGEPGSQEGGFGLGAYISQRLAPALDAVARSGGGSAHLIGYCMGGPITLALAQRMPEQVRRIVTLGAPWDFAAFPEHDNLKHQRLSLDRMIDTMGLLFGAIPPQITQQFFAMRDLASGVRKFRRFAALDPANPETHRFVAVEDWLNDGVPLAPQVARECLIGWMIDNDLREGRWRPGEILFRAEEVTQRALVVAAQRDTVVRVAASEPLATALPNAALLSAPVGHIGMVVGHNAMEAVWQPVAEFLRD